MSVMPGLDIESIELLDFEFAPPCEWNSSSKIHPQCDAAAEWKLITSCCAAMYLMCDPHKVKQLKRMEEYQRAGYTIEHDFDIGGCGALDVKFVVIERL